MPNQTRIPHVPVRTPMFEQCSVCGGTGKRTKTDKPDESYDRVVSWAPDPQVVGDRCPQCGGLGGRLTRTWIIFFERLWNPAGPFQRTLLLKDSTVGDDIADHVTVYAPGQAIRIVGVLRLAITADLTVRVNWQGQPLVIITIPQATAVDEPVEIRGFEINPPAMDVDDVLTWDVLASDGQQDAAGVASFTLEWA